ncbi:DUF4097 domain-containing protein [Mechercharimyces sp. CAU 1602]|uniref:DUF4097 domain-containing protein n=1 Tax=Mechercharimyces sp. CAU 1602 TaxID=2973933 RepID=UPI0021631F08|nr:DUF4097 domain-containing protein [Mechercharimyces sp. CAU 1602]MCS1350709.1 DUF4097 domain-containing protein [Mechercharimyces sp. CAU 1602]
MNKVKSLVLVGFLLMLTGIVGSVVTYIFTNPQVTIADEKSVSEEFNQVQVDVEQIKLEILPSDVDVASVSLRGEGSDRTNKEVKAKVEDGILKVEYDNGTDESWFNHNLFTESLSLEVTLPKRAYASLQVRSGQGEMAIKNLKVEKIDVSTENGAIQLEELKTTTLHIQTENGSIQVQKCTGELVGETTNGGISIMTEDITSPMTLATVNGAIEMIVERRPQNAQFDIEVVNGGIDLFGKSDHHAIMGKGEHHIQLSTENGSITVNQEN